MLTLTQQRFMKFVVKQGGHWLWTGATVKGYGQFQLSSRKTVRAHRIAYEWWVGPIPDDYTIDHLCRVRNCVRPSRRHLEPVPRGINTLRGDTLTARNKAKTHCCRGHRFTPKNTIRRPSRPHQRECRRCAQERRRVK